MAKKDLLSVIIPCFNESEVISLSVDAVCTALEGQPFDYELVLVDDGSRDSTLDILQRLSLENERLKYISFSRNFGKESAMIAGLSNCNGDCAVIMDADLQHPPHLIPRMYEKYKEGFDQVIAKRNRKGDSKLYTLFAKLYYKIANKLVDIEMTDGVGDFRLLSRKAIDAVVALKENNRFSKGLFSWIGFNKVYIDFENQSRAAGKTKWSFKKLLSYGIDGILSFNNKPLRVCIYFGGIFMLISIAYLIYLFVQILLNGIDAPGYFTVILLITCFGGIQLFSLGVIGEYIGRIYYEVKKRPNYIIKSTNIGECKNNEK